MIVKNKIVLSLFALLIVMGSIDIFVGLLLKEYGVGVRFHFVNDIQEVKPVYKEPNKSFWNQAFDENEPVALMSSLMNKVTKIESNSNEDTINLFNHAQQNGSGLVCSGMADIFADILASKKYTVRRVNLYRALADQYSSHSVTEILLTFGASFQIIN